MKICIASDIHMEIGGYPGQTKHLKDGGDLLILAGDITCSRYFSKAAIESKNYPEAKKGRANFDKLMKHWCSRFEKVFYIMGNHESYGFVLDNSAPTMRNYLKETNVRVLENEAEEFKGVMFLGATLWTDFNKDNPTDMYRAQNSMNDYRTISSKRMEEITYVERNHPNQSIKYGLITPHFIYQKHLASRKFLEYNIEHHKDKKTVVITHHAPSLRCQNTNRYGMELAFSYCSEMDDLVEKSTNVALWISGHNHYNYDFMIGKTRLISNQRGYANHERIADDFKPMFVEI
tara:strand:+ start:1157 stop:2026 length:870 start_codon:yes stop_codon:yes gene_type:complete